MATSRFHLLQPRGNKSTIIIFLYSLPVIQFSLLDVGSYNFAAYMFRKNVLFNNRSDMEDAILDEKDNLSGPYCCSRRVLIVRRRNLPWGQPFTLSWTRHRGGVLNAGKTISSENTSVEVQSKHPCTIEYSIPLRRSEFWLSDVPECHSLTTRRGF